MADLKTRLLELTRMKYADQAKWFLNGFWKEGAEAEAENVWKFTMKFSELDPKKKEGCELDEFWSHKFLESLGETLTVIQLREKLRKIDVDLNGKMGLLEYLMFKYSKTIPQVVDAPQGDNQEEIDEAAAKLQAVQDALAEVQRQLEQQEQALAEQKRALEASKRAADEAKRTAQEAKRTADEAKRTADEAERTLSEQKRAEDVVRAAEAELKAAIDDLNNQETNYKNQISTLEAKSKDPSAGTVSKSKAAAELAQLKQEDPLPLRKAKITQEAALRKVEKERKAAEEKTAVAKSAANAAKAALDAATQAAQEAEEAAHAADNAAAEAEAKTQALEEQKARVEAAKEEAEQRVQEALDYLESVKKKGGVAYGAIWWMERELKEAQKYLPKRKQQL